MCHNLSINLEILNFHCKRCCFWEIEAACFSHNKNIKFFGTCQNQVSKEFQNQKENNSGCLDFFPGEENKIWN